MNWNDGKEPGALRTIGEISRALSIKPHILRYWEEKFPVLNPVKRRGGRRYYRSSDIDMIMRIDDLLNKQGYTIDGANKALSGITFSPNPQHAPAEIARAGGQDPHANGGGDHAAESKARIDRSAARITHLKTRLHAIRDALAQAIAD